MKRYSDIRKKMSSVSFIYQLVSENYNITFLIHWGCVHYPQSSYTILNLDLGPFFPLRYHLLLYQVETSMELSSTSLFYSHHHLFLLNNEGSHPYYLAKHLYLEKCHLSRYHLTDINCCLHLRHAFFVCQMKSLLLKHY